MGSCKWLHVRVAKSYRGWMSEVDATGGAQAGVGGAVRRKRRRWPWLVAGVLSIVVCAPVTAVVVWFVRGTVEASLGGKSPTAAVVAVMGAFDRWAEDDLDRLRPYLCREHASELLRRLGIMRHELLNADQSAGLTSADFAEVDTGRGVRVSVRVGVEVPVGDDVRGLFATDRGQVWAFDTVHVGRGWRVCGFIAPAMCGVYVKC
jgi:hypothetical protein